MNIESDLKKDGIEVIKKLDTLTINSLAKNIANKLCSSFPEYGLNENELFIKLSRLDMYIARMPEGMAEANYFYKNTSIYFNEHISNEDLVEFAIHECVHYIQEVKDKKNYLLRMGLCDYTEFKIYGLALNEAAVQLLASKVNSVPKEYVKYFGINFETNSPSYYPLECCLVNQLSYIVGEDVLFESTLKSNDNFKNIFCEKTSPKVYMAIQNALDDIFYAEEDIIKLNNKIIQNDDRNKKVDNMVKKIDELKNEIKLTFFRTQNLIVSSYFNNEIKKINSLEDVDSFRKRLYNMKELLGSAEGYTFFNDYYIEKMAELDHICNVIENGGIETAINIRTIKQSKFMKIVQIIKTLIFGNSKVKEESIN